MVTQDYYATLGLSPASEDVVIRAAYVALVRRYHPDGNPSAAAAARTRAINAAYAVLSDSDRRAEYDLLRASEAWVQPPPRRKRAPPTGLFAAAAVLLLALLLPLAVWSPVPDRALAPPAEAGRAAADTKRDPAPAEPIEVAQAATDPRLAAAPPAVSPAEPTHPADSPPTVRPAMAALPSPAPSAASAGIASLREAAAPAASTAAATRAVATAAPGAKPSFSCSIARTRGEIAVCRSTSLANLDRQQALLYSQSWGRADAAKRAQLLSSRERFIARRDACRSTACTSGAYLARMREVSEIMTGGGQALR